MIDDDFNGTSILKFEISEAETEENEFPYFAVKENIIFEIEDGTLVIHEVENPVEPDKFGYCSYENGEGNLDYILKDSLPDDISEGWYIAIGCELSYIQGDGWMIDNDIEFEFESYRIATFEETERCR